MASIRRDDDGPVALVAKVSAVTSTSCISCFGEEVVAGGGGGGGGGRPAATFSLAVGNWGCVGLFSGGGRGGGSPPAATFSSAGDDAGVLRCVGLLDVLIVGRGETRSSRVTSGDGTSKGFKYPSRPSFLCSVFFRNIVSASAEWTDASCSSCLLLLILLNTK